MFWSKWLTPKPFNESWLPKEKGHKVYFAEFGNPKGRPVIMFHGGPGGSSKARYAKQANLRKYRVIMFDQRGCGKSQPLGKLEHNTTHDLLSDVTRLIDWLNIKTKIILRGASWGSTLALLWAEQNPKKVDKLLLSQVFLANEDYRRWEFDGNRYCYPDFVEKLEKESAGKIVGYYNKLILSDKLQDQLKAANHYGWFERICGSMQPDFGHFTELSPQELASQRIFMHYVAHNFFLGKNDILKSIQKIKKLETFIIHNRLDFVAPLKGAWDIHKALPNSKLIIVPDFGHVSTKLHKTIQKEYYKELK